MSDLTGKVAIITGGGSGIGLASAKLFLEHNIAGLALVDVNAAALAAAVASFSPEDQAKVIQLVADVADEVAVEGYVSKTVERFGRLDISFQNAGIMQTRIPVHETDTELFDRIMRVNVRGPFLGVKHSVRAMLKNPEGGKGCSIINTSSQLGIDGGPGLTAYATSKFSVRGITQCAAVDVGLAGIRVNSIAPGPIETPMIDLIPKDQLGPLAAQAMLGRMGKAVEVANLVLFLASDASSLITGSLFKVDGGWSRYG